MGRAEALSYFCDTVPCPLAYRRGDPFRCCRFQYIPVPSPTLRILRSCTTVLVSGRFDGEMLLTSATVMLSRKNIRYRVCDPMDCRMHGLNNQLPVSWESAVMVMILVDLADASGNTSLSLPVTM